MSHQQSTRRRCLATTRKGTTSRVLTLAACATSWAASSAFAEGTISSMFLGLDAALPVTQPEGGLGHPMIFGPGGSIAGMSRPIPGMRPVPRGAPATVPLPTLSPIVAGAYVNFESPPVRALALSSDGRRLYLANTPAGTLTILETSTTSARILANVPVGIDPVSVAVHPVNGHVWVANHISDDVSVVNPTTREVIAVIDVGDEPVNIAFSPNGRFAYVVLQGPHALAQPPFHQHSSLVTIDVSSMQIASAIELDCNTARGIVVDPTNARLTISALSSGNNTTVVGIPIVRRFVTPIGEPEAADALPSLAIVQQFSATAALFAQSSSLAPYPDVSTVPGAPPVARIVSDGGGAGGTSGIGGQWSQIMSILADASGTPRPDMVALYAQEFNVSNATEILQKVIDDARDTADHDLLVLDISQPATPQVASIIGQAGATITAMTRSPVDGTLVLTNIEPRNLTRHEPNLKGRFVTHQLVTLTGVAAPVIRSFDLNTDVPMPVDPVVLPNPIDATSGLTLANPSDVVAHPTARRAYVAANGSDRIGVIDLQSGRVLARQNVGRGVRSLAINSGGNLLYAYNRTDSTISVLNTTSVQPVLMSTVRVFNPEPRAIQVGRHFAYSAALGAHGASSCTSCHIDINLDHLAWDLGDPNGSLLPAPSNLVDVNGDPRTNHPLKGPMVTQSLRGLHNHNGFHWRGDKPQFTDFNGAFASLLGGSQLSDPDMAAFDAFIKTVQYPPNPFWTRNHAPKDARVIPGVTIFANNCNGCHSIEHDGTLRLAGAPDDAGLDLSGIFAQIQEVTQLRGIYKKFSADRFNGVGLIHDGRESREDDNHPLETFLKTFFRNLNAQDRVDLTATVTAFPSNATNITGWQQRITALSPQTHLDAVSLMIDQNHALPSRCDVVARGIVGGVNRGFVYDPSLDGTDPLGPVFRDDRGNTLPLQTLLSMLAPADYLMFIATSPGSGVRVGIDADLDCALNALDPFPYSSPDIDGDGQVAIQDIFSFLNLWFAGTPAADFNFSGSVEVQDVFDALNHWFAGGC